MQPNIIFILADDWGWGDLSMHGHPVIRTPHIDKLASDGTSFNNFITNSPICAPSRVSMVTGRFPSALGIHNNFKLTHTEQPMWLEPSLPILPRELQLAGYRTAHYGKWHLSAAGDANAPIPTAYGYDDSAVYAGNGPRLVDTRPLPPAYTNAVERGESPTYDGILTELAVNRALDFISQSSPQPFFVNLWIKEGHAPYDPPQHALNEYRDHPDEGEKIYYASITEADRQIGRLLARINQLGLRGNTIVIFTSDNGPETPTMHNPYSKRWAARGSTGGLRGRKRSLFCGGGRLPCVVRWPGVTPSGKLNTETVLSGVDWLPTLLAAAGVSPPPNAQLDGENLLSALQGADTQRTKTLFNSFYYTHDQEPNWYSKLGDQYQPHAWPQLSIRQADWKLVHSIKEQRTELYNVRNDPFEQRDKSSASPGVANRMMRELMAWWETVPQP